MFGWKQVALLAAGLGLVGAGAVLLAPAARSAMRERSMAPAAHVALPPGRMGWLAAAAVLVAGALLVWTRLQGINQGLWHDEAFSVMHFARGGPRAILGSQEYVPNDHVLFNLLSWATAGVVGESPAARRLWAVVPALLAVALVVRWAWWRLDAGVAVTFVLLATISTVHLELAKEARGYGLTFLCGAAMLLAADRLANGGGREALGAFALAGFAGIATLPVFALGFLAQAAPLVWWREARERVLVAVLATGVASLVLYWSLLEDVVGNADQRFGVQVPWHGLITGPLDVLVGPLLGVVTNVVYQPDLAWRLAAATLVALGAIALVRRGEGRLLALVTVPMVGTFGLLAAGRFFVETRFSSFLLLHALLLVAVGLSAVGSAIARVPIVRTVAAAGTVLLLAVTTGRVLDLAHEQGAFPREAFAQAAEVVRGSGIARVVSDTIRPEGLQYALGDQRFTTEPADELQRTLCTGPAPLVFVSQFFGHAPTDTSCLTRRGASRVRLPQRDRGGRIDVWLLAGRGAR